MGKPSAPPAPDYVGAANAQGAANLTAGQQTASLSNPNVTTPYGSQTVNYTPTGPNGDYQPNITQSLTPQAQQTLDAQQRVQTGLANLGEQGLGTAQKVLGTPFDQSNVPKAPINPGQTAQDAIMARLQPQIQQNSQALTQQLANQGIPQGSEAWNNAMRQQGQQQNDLYSQAALQGIGLDTQAHQSGLQEALGLYNQPLNQITALMSGSQIQSPQFQQYQGSNVQATPIANATNQEGQWAQGLYGQQMAGANSTQQGLTSLGSLGLLGYLALSDVRLKSDIVKVGNHPKGFGIYEYTIQGRRERGVLAQEVELVMPSAVVAHASGFKMVDYGAVNA